MKGTDDEEIVVGQPFVPTTTDLGAPIEPQTIEVKREHVRKSVTMTLTYAISTISGAVIASAIIWPDRVPAIKEIVPLIVPGLFGIYGAIIGYYFGETK